MHPGGLQGSIFFSLEEGLAKFFPTRAKKEVHGSEDHYSAEAEDKAARESFIFMGRAWLCPQILTLDRSPSSLLYPLNAEGRHKTQ